MDVKNKVAIITGGIGGIGFATGQDLLRNGVQYVALLDILQPSNPLVIENLKKLEEEFDKTNFGYYSCDVTNVNEFKECFEKVKNSQKYVHILVNNAGILDATRIDLMIDLNFKSVVNCTMTAIDFMGTHKGNDGGVVLNVSSTAGVYTAKLHPIYTATKHGVVSFVRAMKHHNTTLGMRIVAICPNKTSSLLTKNMSAVKWLPFVKPEEIEEWNSAYGQKPESVALAIVQMLKEAKEGDVWVCDSDNPPFVIEEGENLEDKMEVIGK